MSARDWALLILLGAIWGGSFFFARVAVAEVHPLTLVLFRVAIAAIALQLYLPMVGLSFRVALPFAGSFLALGLINNALPFSLLFIGQTELGAGLAAVLNATTPFWTVVVANLTTVDEKLTWNKLAGVALGVAGTAIMIGPGLLSGLGGPLWPKLVVISASISYAFGLVLSKRFRALPPTVVATGQFTAAAIIMVPVVLVWNGTSGLFSASPHVWASIVALALLSTAFAYIVYFNLIKSAGATNVSLVTLLVPVSAIMLGVAFLGERLELFEVLGMGVIVLGLLTIDGRFFQKK